MNVILITIDDLRADHLGCYGYLRNVSPNIDKLAGESSIFLNCFAASSYTVQSSPALLTGKYLGIFSNFNDTLTHNNILDKRWPTLSEYLRNFGYFTAAYINNPHYRSGTGFERGFEVYKSILGNAKIITDEASSFLNNYSKDRPFFLWLHYLDLHSPYRRREEYYSNFENDELYKKNDRILQTREKGHSNPCVSEGCIPPIVFQKDMYSLSHYIACYDSSIAYTDFYLGKLLDNIKDDNTMVVITSDHGESMGEHNVYFSHGENIYDELLHIPLIIKNKDSFKDGKTISTAVSSVDIVPTILNRVNPIWGFFNKTRFDGKDLKIAVKGRNISRKYIYAYHPRNPCTWSIRDVDKNVKYIFNEDGREELYFSRDEYTNHINDGSPESVHFKKKMKGNLKIWLKRYPLRSDLNPQQVSVDESMKNHLRSLGYIQ